MNCGTHIHFKTDPEGQGHFKNCDKAAVLIDKVVEKLEEEEPVAVREAMKKHEAAAPNQKVKIRVMNVAKTDEYYYVIKLK